MLKTLNIYLLIYALSLSSVQLVTSQYEEGLPFKYYETTTSLSENKENITASLNTIMVDISRNNEIKSENESIKIETSSSTSSSFSGQKFESNGKNKKF